jgi:branched-chain amino acid transport system ATP-binding protein
MLAKLLKMPGTIDRSGVIFSIIVATVSQMLLGLADRLMILDRGAATHGAGIGTQADPP